MKHEKELSQMISIAKQHGLKRLKVGSLEIELSEYYLAKAFTDSIAAETPENLTPANNTQAPSPSSYAIPYLADKDDDSLLPQLTDEDDEALLFHSSR